jgi:cobalt-precorrin-5B (C1)-methyltransferase
VRFERIFPPREADITWIDDYSQVPTDIHTLLATTGVQSISKLKYLEAEGIKVFYRILHRESSIALAKAQGAEESQLCYYEDDNTIDIDADAILLKESGESGGFSEKVKAARAKGMRIIALKRPLINYSLYNINYTLVNGPHGLRRMIEHLLPDFFPLKSGLTTGTCATAAAVAALCRLHTGQTPENVPVRLPDGETISVPVGYSDDYAFCLKDAGDDPDVTNGVEIRASVQPAEDFVIKGGDGVGRFTLPGFDYPPGEPAINRGPRQMLRENIPGNYSITISVEHGAELARRTFNPRLGIEGGISIIGVSGIVQPYSEEAFLESIRKCLEVACASGAERIVLGSGAKSENALRALYPELPTQAFVQYGNFVGETLQMAAALGCNSVTLGVMLGKAVKLAAGQLDTHSRRATFDRDFVRQLLIESHCDAALADSVTLVRELWDLLPSSALTPFVHTVLDHCCRHCLPLLPNGELTILLIDDEGRIYQL